MLNTIIIFTAKYLYILIVLTAIILLWFSPKEKGIPALKLMALAIPIAYLLALISSHFIIDPRPFVVEHVTPLLPHSTDNGFPSDHTLVSMMATLTVFYFNKKAGSLLAVLAVGVGVSRVIAKLHHPLDIVGSVTIAISSFLISWLILKNTNRKKVQPS